MYRSMLFFVNQPTSYYSSNGLMSRLLDCNGDPFKLWLLCMPGSSTKLLMLWMFDWFILLLISYFVIHSESVGVRTTFSLRLLILELEGMRDMLAKNCLLNKSSLLAVGLQDKGVRYSSNRPQVQVGNTWIKQSSQRLLL